MVSSPVSKKEDAEATTVNKSPVTLVLGPKPLINHRFYLDVKNHLTSSKLEAKIKDLGGLLELFLVKEVTHVVSDKEGWTNTNKGGGSIPKTPQTPSNSASVSNDYGSPIGNPVRGRPKTRADAMLEKARTTPTDIAKDPLEKAKNWGIPHWSVEKAFCWLEKVAASIKKSNKRKTKVVELKAPYIKFEAFDRKTRPVFKEIRNWPRFNFSGGPGSTAIIHRPEDEKVRKPRSSQRTNTDKVVDPGTQPGYCEICREDYVRLDQHLDGEKHSSFVNNDENYKDLDDLINDGVNIESFLKLTGTHVLDDTSGIAVNCSPPLTPHKMPRNRTSSLYKETVKNSPVSPTGSDSGHRLRSRRSVMTNSYIGMTADEPDTPVKPEGAKEIRELRSTHRNALLRIAEAESDTWESGRPKRACIKQKRFSADERLVSDNRSYYKVEVMTTKLRSSAIGSTKEADVKRAHTPISEDDEEENDDDEEDDEDDQPLVDDKGLIVKFRRMRTSELKQLNNEAEQFLFPKKEDDSSSDEDLDADGPDTTASTRKGGESSMLLSSEDEGPLRPRVVPQEVNDPDDDEEQMSVGSNYSDESNFGNGKKRRRRTHAEAFILDNQKYYKFETPGSRLRYQGSFMADFPPINNTKNNGDVTKKVDAKEQKVVAKKEAEEEDEEIEDGEEEVPKKVKFNFDEMKFSFERIPKSEPWYTTFRRQDQGEEYYTCFSDSGYWKPFLLPYEMGPIQPLDPRVCISAYTQIKKQIFEETSSGTTSVGCSTPDPTSSDQHNHLDVEENSKASEDSMIQETTVTEDCSQDETDNLEMKIVKKRRRLVPGGKNPRKSPRQHASTLAILSSLIQQRKKREFNRNRNSELNSSKRSLPDIPEGEQLYIEDDMKDDMDEKPLPLTENEIMAKSIDDMLSAEFADFKNLEQIEISCEEDVLTVNYKSDAIEILQDYENHKHNARKTGLASPVRRCYSPGKKPGRKKKKKNRTGWPNKNNRVKMIKKEVIDETMDESTIDSLSVMADSEDLELCDDGSNLTDINGDVNSIKELNESFGEHIAQFVNKTNDQSTDVYNISNEIVQNNSFSVVKEDRVNVKNNCTDFVIPNDNNKMERVVDLDRWENAEKVLSNKLTNDVNKDIQFQPYVRVQKLDDEELKTSNRRLRSSSSPHRTNIKRARRMPASPKSPRVLRKPRGRWYRER